MITCFEERSTFAKVHKQTGDCLEKFSKYQERREKKFKINIVRMDLLFALCPYEYMKRKLVIVFFIKSTSNLETKNPVGNNVTNGKLSLII
jgi:hypothetical protein